MTLRNRLAIALAIPLVLTLTGGIVIHWAYAQVRWYRDLADREFLGFSRIDELARISDRYFRLKVGILLEDPGVVDESVRLRERLEQTKAGLQAFVTGTVAASSAAHHEPAPALVALAPRIIAVLESALSQFDQAERLLDQGLHADASTLTVRVLRHEIEAQLAPAFDAALAAQHDHYVTLTGALAAEIDRWQFWLYAALGCATAVGAVTVEWVLRSLKAPLQALAIGTEAIAAGKLAWRVPVAPGNELGDLARHFNHMAQELERQYHALLENQLLLEARIAERTSQLNERNEELWRLDKFRRQFFADISHELKTPLTVMRGEAEVTLRGRDKTVSEYRACLQRIQVSTMQLDRLVSELLLLAQAESGHLEFASEQVDFRELAVSVVDDLRVLAQPKSIEVRWIQPQPAAWISGDRSRLRQAMLVLGDNACRYSPAGSVVELSLETSNDEALFAVADRGIGIPPDDTEKIFDRYYRSDNARHTRADGTGLGLPVARTIVTAHGGRITVTSRPGGGTVFCIVLPLLDPGVTNSPV